MQHTDPAADHRATVLLQTFQSNYEGALIDKIAALADAQVDGPQGATAFLERLLRSVEKR